MDDLTLTNKLVGFTGTIIVDSSLMEKKTPWGEVNNYKVI